MSYGLVRVVGGWESDVKRIRRKQAGTMKFLTLSKRSRKFLGLLSAFSIVVLVVSIIAFPYFFHTILQKVSSEQILLNFIYFKLGFSPN